MPLKTPDITPAQLVAVVGAVISVAVSFGTPISADQRDAILQLVSILAPIIVIADAFIRRNRAKFLGSGSA